MKALNKIKINAANNMASNINLVTSVTSEQKEEVLLEMPKMKSLLDLCRIIKNENKIFFDSSAEDIPEFYRKDAVGNKFLQFDKGCFEENRFVLFFSDYNTVNISITKTVLVDGTFWSVPSNFVQLVTINSYMFGKFFPLCYILMSNKTEQLYNEAFAKLKELTHADFKTIIIDFEFGLKNALESIFGERKCFGCTFHFGQCLWRKIQNMGLSSEYINDKRLNKILRHFLNLIFVPVEYVIIEFNKLVDTCRCEFGNKLDNFIKYFKKTFVGDDCYKPLYNIEFWSAYERVIKNKPRTINSLEAWHRGLNFRCNVAHPNFAKFLDIIKVENEKVRVEMVQGRKSVYLNAQNLKKEQKLRFICDSFEYYDNQEYLENLACIFSWKIYE